MTGMARTSTIEQTATLDEFDRLMNDPDEPVMRPARVWSLLAALTAHDLPSSPRRPHAAH